ncbi:unnamed protein product [Dicrocoelium dendriticum]|nr:unnamed protein product [Dicrocoelium dendriticum]
MDLVTNNEFIGISNNILADLKSSYPYWEDVVSKAGKLHSSINLVAQHSAAFFDAIQKVADLASRASGGGREIGACLTRVCLRQRRLQTKLKSLSNHLLTSVATPLSTKVDEWRRALVQLEKDRARQTKRTRTDLKRLVSEAAHWQKKMAKYNNSGSTSLGPGVGHGILPLGATKASEVAIQASNAMRLLHSKAELYEASEKSSIRSLMLEERKRFCFFLTCLLPVLECQVSMLSEISALEELIQSLADSASTPDRLTEDAESMLVYASRGECIFHPDSAHSSVYDLDRSSSLIAAAATTFVVNHDRAPTRSDETDSSHLPVEANMERKEEDRLDTCNLASSTQSSFHAYGFGSCSPAVSSMNSAPENRENRINDGDAIACDFDHLSSSASDATSLSIGGVSSHSSSDGTGNATHRSPGCTAEQTLVGDKQLSNCSPVGHMMGSDNHMTLTSDPHSSEAGSQDETQFQTLCRPGHYRLPRSCAAFIAANGSQPQIEKAAFISHNPDSIVDQEWLRHCDGSDEENDTDDGGDEEQKPASDIEAVGSSMARLNSTLVNPLDDEDDAGGEYVRVQEDIEELHFAPPQPVPNEALDDNGHLAVTDSCGLNSGRHTISSVYERSGNIGTRTPIHHLVFNPLISKSSSKDSGMASSTVLYPNQALPPPVYTNLTQLADAAQRKFSIPRSSGLCNPNRQLLPVHPSAGGGCSGHELTPRDYLPNATRPRPTGHMSSVRSVPYDFFGTAESPNSRAGPLDSRTCSNGLDPFSVEMDELDKLGATVGVNPPTSPPKPFRSSDCELKPRGPPVSPKPARLTELIASARKTYICSLPPTRRVSVTRPPSNNGCVTGSYFPQQTYTHPSPCSTQLMP